MAVTYDTLHINSILEYIKNYTTFPYESSLTSEPHIVTFQVTR